jgi:hypothetical protein
VDADDLLVGTDRWRMASLAVENDGSVTMTVVLPGTTKQWRSECVHVGQVTVHISGAGGPALAWSDAADEIFSELYARHALMGNRRGLAGI